jgi:hypothetical protein
MRPDHRQLETATSGGLSDYPVTPSKEPGSVDEAVIGLEPVGRDAVRLPHQRALTATADMHDPSCRLGAR